MKNYAKIGNKRGRPGYRTPSSFKGKKIKYVDKSKSFSRSGQRGCKAGVELKTRGSTSTFMNLIIDLSKEEPCLVLKQDNKKIESYCWKGLYQLSETLILEIDKFLKKNKIKLKDIKEIKVVPSKKSMVSTRIAKAVALGLKIGD